MIAVAVSWMLAVLAAAPSFAADEPLLAQLLADVEAYAPRLQAARASADAEAAAQQRARSRYFGELDLFARDSHFNDPRLTRSISPPVNINTLPFDDNQIGYGVNARLPLDVNGRITAQFRAARGSAAAAAAAADDELLRLLNDAARLYRGLQRIAGQRDALEKQSAALEAHLRVAAAAIRVGRIAKVERLRLVAEQQGVQSQLAALQGKEAGLRARLGALLGRERYEKPVAAAADIPEAPEAAGAVAARPDVVAARQRVSAAEASIRAARADRLPALNVNATWERNQGYDGAGGDATWQLLVQAEVPVFDGGGRRAEVSQARAKRLAAQQQLAALRDASRAEVFSAQADWKAARARHAASRAAVTAALETARIQRDRFEAGRLSAADLVDAEAALAAARSDLSTALADWWQADDAWRLALGNTPAAYVRH